MYTVQYLDHDAVWKNSGLSSDWCSDIFNKRNTLRDIGFNRPIAVALNACEVVPASEYGCIYCCAKNCEL